MTKAKITNLHIQLDDMTIEGEGPKGGGQRFNEAYPPPFSGSRDGDVSREGRSSDGRLYKSKKGRSF